MIVYRIHISIADRIDQYYSATQGDMVIEMIALIYEVIQKMSG